MPWKFSLYFIFKKIQITTYVVLLIDVDTSQFPLYMRSLNKDKYHKLTPIAHVEATQIVKET